MGKLEYLETYYKVDFNKYYRAMNYQIMSVEIDALFNLLIKKMRSKYKLTSRHEDNVIRILKLKTWVIED